jgi:hypothetical protein
VSYPKQLLRLRPTGGLARDVPPWEVGPNHFTGGDNFECRLGFPQRVSPFRVAYDPPNAPPYELVNVNVGGVNYWVYVGDDSQHVVEGATHSDVTILAGLQTAAFGFMHSLPILNGVAVHNNGLDAPMYWPGAPASPFLELPDWPAGVTCKRMVAHKFHLFALDLDEPGGVFQNKVKWSDAAEPGTIPDTWTPAADNEAGDVELADSQGRVQTAATLRDSLLIYKRNAVYLVDYVGGVQVYAFRTLFKNVGALTRRAVAVTERGHLVVTDGDIVMIDGNNVQSIAAARMRDTLFAQLDQENFEELFAVYYRAKREVWICYPESGSTLCDRALVYNVDNDAWSERDVPESRAAAVGVVNDSAPSEAWDDDTDTWDGDFTLWNEQFISNAERLMFAMPGDTEFQLADSSEIVALDSVVSKHDITFGEPERLKFIRRVHIRAERTSGSLYVRVGQRMTPGDAVTWQTERELALDQQFINCTVLGRYISIEIRSEGTDPWKVTGADFEIEMRGYH